jgi:hypothetical protein
MVRYYSKPTAHVNTATLTVTTPANAYDGITTGNATRASFQYDQVAGNFTVKSFNNTLITTDVGIVDIKIKYAAEIAQDAADQYRIVYYVGTSGPVILQDWTGVAYSSINTGAVREWKDQSEPTDGVWSAADIANLKIIVFTKAGDNDSTFEEYEVWLLVYTHRHPTIWVNPATQTNPSSPFNVTIDVATVDDLYGFEFKLYYDKTILTIQNVWLGPLLNTTAGGTANTFGVIKEMTDAYNATHGRVWATQTITGDRQGATTNAGTLAKLNFTVDGASGTTTLDLDDTKLIGYEWSSKRLIYMQHTATDGTVTISGVPEFPFGAALEISLVGVIAYLWWRGKRRQPRSLVSKPMFHQ